jgi:tetrahydromethanopterin S-methyltransferase subunit G
MINNFVLLGSRVLPTIGAIFFWGFVFGLILLLLYIYIPNKNKKGPRHP